MLLTGELTSARSESLVAPRTDVMPIQVRRLAEDGSAVRAGDPVVEFDNSQFTSQIEEKRLAVANAGSDITRGQAEAQTAIDEKQFDVEQRRSDLEKAKIKAAVPEGVLATREYQERQTALRKAEVELLKAQESLKAQREASAADLATRRISLEKSRREIAAAERAIQVLTLRAPRDGIAIVADHPWEGRKFQEGDQAFPGMVIANLPELSSLQVEAVLSDVDDGRVRPGMPVVVTLDAYPAVSFTGRVTDVKQVARELNRNPMLRFFPVTVALDRVDVTRMRPGMSVRVEVRSKPGTAPQGTALLAPRAALDLAASPPRARLADGSSAQVRLGPCSAQDCVILAGLREGDKLRAAGPAGKESAR
jgi:multidrug resistance efflux pump